MTALFLSLSRRLLTAVVLFAVPLTGVVDAASSTYSVVESKSSVRIHVGKSGAFSFAGHKHEVLAPVSGTVIADPANLGGSSVELTFASAKLTVSAEGEPSGDAPKVQDIMRGPKVLDSAAFPEIHFKSKKVTGQTGTSGLYELSLVGELGLHGMTRDLTVPVKVKLEGSTLTATGSLTLLQDQFGIKPVTAGGGAVKVKNEIEIDFQIVAERR